MRKNLLTIIGIVIVVAGAAVSTFANFPLADITGLASVMFGAGLACAAIWNKRDKEKALWMSVLSIVLVAGGAFLLGFCGFAESTMTTIITSVAGLVAIILGLVIQGIKAKKAA